MPRALMVRTKEGKYLIAEEGTKPSLLSFAKAFKASVFAVTTANKPLNLHGLVLALNNMKELPSEPPRHSREIPIYIPQEKEESKASTVIKKDNYQDYLNQADKVKRYIEGQLLKGNAVCLTGLQEWAVNKGVKLSKGGLSRHLQKVLDWAISRGYKKIKEGRFYRIEK